MATATATPGVVPVPTTLEGHDHEFQYLKDEDRSELTGNTNSQMMMEPEVSPSDILAQLSAAELNAQLLISPSADPSVNTPEQPSEQTPMQDNTAPVTPPQAPTPLVANTNKSMMVPPPAPVKQKDEFQYWQEADGDAESVEISHLIAQQEQAPPSPIPYIPEEPEVAPPPQPMIVVDEGPIEEPFDCVPVDDSAEGIMKQLEKVVHRSDRVLHPNQYNPKGEKLSQQEMAMMTPKRSGDPMKSPANSDCGSTIGTGGTLMSRASVSITGKNRKPQQPIMKLRVNDSQFAPLDSVVNEQEEMPFDETTSHNFKTALRNMITATKAAAVTAMGSPTSTPDTTLLEGGDWPSDDDTTNYGDEDEWTADTSRYTDGTTEYTTGGGDTDDDTASAYTMDTPMDEAPTAKSRKVLRRQKLLARAKAVDKKTKEQAGWDEMLLDAVFSPDVTETALEVADYLQSGAEVTISMTKGMLQDAVKQLEKEEQDLNGIPEEDGDEEEEEEEDTTDAGDAAYRNIAAAATGSNLNGDAGSAQEEDEDDDETNTQTSRANKDSHKAVKDPWDQPKEAFGKGENSSSFADLMSKGLPLMNRKLERMINEWTKTTEAGKEAKEAEERASAAAAEANDEPVVEDQVPGENEVAVPVPIETPAAAEAPVEIAVETEEEKKEPEEDDDDKPVEEGSSTMAQLELEDAQDAIAAEEASTLSLEQPTKRLSV